MEQIGGVLAERDASADEDARMAVDDPAEDRLAAGGPRGDERSVYDDWLADRTRRRVEEPAAAIGETVRRWFVAHLRAADRDLAGHGNKLAAPLSFEAAERLMAMDPVAILTTVQNVPSAFDGPCYAENRW